jgi:hypothetical protein
MSLYYLILTDLEIFKLNSSEEMLRERAMNYIDKNKSKDFWILKSSSFIKQTNIFKEITKTLYYQQNKNKDYYILLSTDETFINWYSLRVGYFENLGLSTEKNITINGIVGKIETSMSSFFTGPIDYFNVTDQTIN